MLKSVKIEYALLSIFLTTNIAGSSIAPMLPSIASNFKGGEDLSKLILTIPSLLAIPFILFSAILLKIFTKRTLILTGLSIYCFSGVASFLSFSENYLLFFRGLMGIGAGLIMPYATALITDYYKDDKKDLVLSKSGISSNLGGIILLTSIGFLTSIYWRLGFLVPLISLLPMYLLYTQIHPKIQTSYHKYPFVFNIIFKKEIFLISLVYFLIMVLVFQYFSSISFVIKQNNIGGPFHAGIAQSFYMMAGIISNSLMNLVKKVSPNLLYAFQMLFVAQGFFTLYDSNLDFIKICFASFLIGIGFGSFGNSMISLATNYATKINRASTISLLIASMCLGQFVSTIFFSYIAILFHINKYFDIFLIEGIIFIIIALFLFSKFIVANYKTKIIK